MTAQDAHSGRTAPAEGTDMDAAIEAVQNVLVAYNVRFAISREIAEAAVRAAEPKPKSPLPPPM